MNEFIAENLIWIMTCVFGAGGLWFLVQQMGKRLDQHEAKIEAKFDALTQRDLAQDRRIGDLETAQARIEERVTNLTGWTKDMRDKIDGIYKKLLGGE